MASAVRTKLKGTVKTIKKQEGYGFLTHQATGTDHFFHRSAVINGGFDELEQDQPVEFEPVEGPKGARAIDVRPI